MKYNFNKITCFFGFHKWTQDFISRGSNAHLLRLTCLVCGKKRVKHKLQAHTWSEWRYDNKDSCVQSSKCLLCAKIKQRQVHIWSDWEYESADSCDQKSICKRCSQKRTQKEAHNWVYEFGDSCEGFSICGHCGVVRTGKGHDWSEWEYKNENSYEQISTCHQCGKIKKRFPGNNDNMNYDMYRYWDHDMYNTIKYRNTKPGWSSPGTISFHDRDQSPNK